MESQPWLSLSLSRCFKRHIQANQGNSRLSGDGEVCSLIVLQVWGRELWHQAAWQNWNSKNPQTSANIRKHQLDSEQIPIQKSVRYVFFLRVCRGFHLSPRVQKFVLKPCSSFPSEGPRDVTDIDGPNSGVAMSLPDCRCSNSTCAAGCTYWPHKCMVLRGS